MKSMDNKNLYLDSGVFMFKPYIKKIFILIVFILLIQISIYGQQKPVLTIFDFQSKQVPLNTVKILENHFNDFFNNQGFYKLVSKDEIKKVLKEFHLRSNQVG